MLAHGHSYSNLDTAPAEPAVVLATLDPVAARAAGAVLEVEAAAEGLVRPVAAQLGERNWLEVVRMEQLPL